MFWTPMRHVMPVQHQCKSLTYKQWGYLQEHADSLNKTSQNAKHKIMFSSFMQFDVFS